MVRKILVTSDGWDSNKEIKELTLTIIGKCKKILIIPGITEEENVKEEFRIKYQNILKEIQRTFPQAITLNYRKMNAQSLQGIDGIIISSGHPDEILNKIKSSKIEEILKNKVVNIVTRSAGSLLIGKKCIITPDEEYPTLNVLEGLDLLPFSVEVHYNKGNDKELDKIKTPLFAIPDGSAILVENNWIKKIGFIKKLF